MSANDPAEKSELAHSDTEAPPPPDQSELDAAAQPSHADPRVDPLIGRLIDDRYRVMRPLAKGGMGAVFVAEHVSLHREVALKVVRPEFAGHGEIATRFAREAIATAQFEHPHVVSAIDYGTLPEGGAYFVMQLVRGRSLRLILKEAGSLPWRRVCAIGAQVADALSAARARGIIHRDLKPDNLLVEVREDGSDLVKILDFGIARMDSAPGEGPEEAMPGQALTRVGMVMGTPGYMAPEQAVGDQLDHRADLYSLGVVLWEAITGKSLWTGDDITAIITKQMRDVPPSMSSVRKDGGWPADLEQLVGQLLARNSANRPEHPGDVRDALRALSLAPTGDWGTSRTLFLEGIGGSHKPLVPKLLDQTRLTWKQAQRWAKGSPKGAAVAGLAALIALALVFSGGDSEVPTKGHKGSAASASRAKDADSETTLEQVMKVAEHAVRPAVRALASSNDPPLPPELATPVEDMLDNPKLAARRKAAKAVLDHEPQSQVPKYLVAIANLEATNSCSKRRDALHELAKLGDERAKPSVARYHDSAPTGCGFLGMNDCYQCIRSDLRETMKALGGGDDS